MGKNEAREGKPEIKESFQSTPKTENRERNLDCPAAKPSRKKRKKTFPKSSTGGNTAPLGAEKSDFP